MVQSSPTEVIFKKLRAFSVAANKQAPFHPLDQERWREFVIGAHREYAQLAAEEVRDWLIDQGFPEYQARRLAVAYESGRNLLKHYDQTR